MTGLEIAGIIGIIGWAGEQILVKLPVPQNSTFECLRDAFAFMVKVGRFGAVKGK